MQSSLRLDVLEQDATTVTGLPALVVPANRQLTLGWGTHLAEKVLHQAGREVEQDLLRRFPRGIALGAAVLGPAGRMTGFQALVHAAVLDKYDFNPLFLLRLRHRTSVATLHAATLDALRCLDAAALEGAVFTPMGAGVGGMPDGRCAETMVHAIRTWSRAHPTSPLQRVVVACRQPGTAAAFRKCIDQ